MSELARKLIEENIAKRERGEDASYLDLGRCGLREVPDLSQMHWLETLIVSNGWWDMEQNRWIDSQNTGSENNFTLPPAHPLPDSLRKLIFGGVVNDTWPIDDWRFLEDLTSLTYLNLCEDQISDVRFLRNLTNLTSLYLDGNQISSVRFLGKLTNLRSLSLNNNQVEDVKFLKDLTRLTSLNLGDNQISDGTFLGNLTNLVILNLSRNQISNGEFLKQLTTLHLLDLGFNQISDGEFLKDLKNLISIDLSFNEINDGQFLKNLTNLISLNVGFNKISNWGFLDYLTNLQSLSLGGSEISDGRFLGKLTKLSFLIIKSSQISDWRFLENLTELTTLGLNVNKISDLQFLKNLTNLTSLDLLANEISDIYALKNLTNLTFLDLRLNRISDGQVLENLTNLKILLLDSNQISDVSFLGNLTGLTSLRLSKNQISDVRFLENLTRLAFLDLSSNKIGDVRFLKNLTNLISLNLRENQISDLRFLEELTELTSLDLRDNQISDGYFLGNLTKLTSLDLRDNQISDGYFLGNLTKLTSLDLRGNKINRGQFGDNLAELTSLDLSFNQISDGRFLEKLNVLRYLNLRGNEISDGQFLGNLTGLTSLDLSDNQISDGPLLENLTKLASLNLGKNQISDGRFLENLTGLTSLDLSYNQISDGHFLEKLTSLTSLYLSGNQISDLRFLENLTDLTSLDLSGNQISDLCFLENLTGLTYLKLRDNQISDLTPILHLIKKGALVNSEMYDDEGINLHNNPLTTPPPEIVQQGNAAILRYFEQLEKEGTERVLEAKLLLLGEGGAGKTSLLRRLKGQPMPEEAESTQGIDIQEYAFETREGASFKANIWDFGGQEIYHATHQFFLTKRSLYILVADVRKEDTDFDYWLQVIELLAGDSPVLIFQNEKGGRKKVLNQQGLQARFGSNIRKFESFDLKTDDEGLERLRREIEHQLQQLPHMQQDLPRTWAAVRQNMIEQQDSRAFVADSAYYEACQAEGITGAETNDLSQYLHDLGVFLHFQDDPILKRWVFLDNEWVTDGMYAILDNEQVVAQKGHFARTDASSIWTEERYRDMHDELLQLMLKFELAYGIPDRPGQYIAPQLLAADEPALLTLGADTLQLRYDYGFMPKGLLSRLIVRLHRYIEDTEREIWRTGAILHRAGTKAELREVYGTRRISLRVAGPQAKELMTIVAEEIDRLNGTFTNLKVRKLVPCICSECRRSGEPYFHAYEKLMRARERNRKTVECALSFEDVPVLRLIDSVFVTTFFTPRPLEVFFSYSRADKAHLDELIKHLSPFSRDGELLTWHDRDLLPGEEWDKRIRQQLAKADIIVLLVSADYLATEYVWTELDIALQRHARAQAIVVPVIVRPCVWQDAPFARLSALPDKGKPITQWKDPDGAWAEVAAQIQRLTKRLQQ